MPKREYMDDPDTKWRHGCRPDYSVVNTKYMKEKTNNHAADSQEKFVENLVKTWEVENAYKIKPEVRSLNDCDISAFECEAHGYL